MATKPVSQVISAEPDSTGHYPLQSFRREAFLPDVSDQNVPYRLRRIGERATEKAFVLRVDARIAQVGQKRVADLAIHAEETYAEVVDRTRKILDQPRTPEDQEHLEKFTEIIRRRAGDVITYANGVGSDRIIAALERPIDEPENTGVFALLASLVH